MIVRRRGSWRWHLQTAVRAIGRLVCLVRGHDFYSGQIALRSWCAYQCVRCGALDRPIESLPDAPEDSDVFGEDDPRADEVYERSQRWFPWWRWPRWI